MVLPVSSPLYILWQAQPKTFASDAALRCTAPLYVIKRRERGWSWYIVANNGAMVRGGEQWVDGHALPLQLWLMGNAHIRSGQ